jgi:hypothetical protein
VSGWRQGACPAVCVSFHQGNHRAHDVPMTTCR